MFGSRRAGAACASAGQPCMHRSATLLHVSSEPSGIASICSSRKLSAKLALPCFSRVQAEEQAEKRMGAAPMTEGMGGRRLRQVRAALQGKASTAWLIGCLSESAVLSWACCSAARAASTLRLALPPPTQCRLRWPPPLTEALAWCPPASAAALAPAASAGPGCWAAVFDCTATPVCGTCPAPRLLHSLRCGFVAPAHRHFRQARALVPKPFCCPQTIQGARPLLYIWFGNEHSC